MRPQATIVFYYCMSIIVCGLKRRVYEALSLPPKAFMCILCGVFALAHTSFPSFIDT